MTMTMLEIRDAAHYDEVVRRMLELEELPTP
jgi:hypothetical protein